MNKIILVLLLLNQTFLFANLKFKNQIEFASRNVAKNIFIEKVLKPLHEQNKKNDGWYESQSFQRKKIGSLRNFFDVQRTNLNQIRALKSAIATAKKLSDKIIVIEELADKIIKTLPTFQKGMEGLTVVVEDREGEPETKPNHEESSLAIVPIQGLENLKKAVEQFEPTTLIKYEPDQQNKAFDSLKNYIKKIKIEAQTFEYTEQGLDNLISQLLAIQKQAEKGQRIIINELTPMMNKYKEVVNEIEGAKEQFEQWKKVGEQFIKTLENAGVSEKIINKIKEGKINELSDEEKGILNGKGFSAKKIGENAKMMFSVSDKINQLSVELEGILEIIKNQETSDGKRNEATNRLGEILKKVKTTNNTIKTAIIERNAELERINEIQGKDIAASKAHSGRIPRKENIEQCNNLIGKIEETKGKISNWRTRLSNKENKLEEFKKQYKELKTNLKKEAEKITDFIGDEERKNKAEEYKKRTEEDLKNFKNKIEEIEKELLTETTVESSKKTILDSIDKMEETQTPKQLGIFAEEVETEEKSETKLNEIKNLKKQIDTFAKTIENALEAINIKIDEANSLQKKVVAQMELLINILIVIPLEEDDKEIIQKALSELFEDLSTRAISPYWFQVNGTKSYGKLTNEFLEDDVPKENIVVTYTPDPKTHDYLIDGIDNIKRKFNQNKHYNINEVVDNLKESLEKNLLDLDLDKIQNIIKKDPLKKENTSTRKILSVLKDVVPSFKNFEKDQIINFAIILTDIKAKQIDNTKNPDEKDEIMHSFAFLDALYKASASIPEEIPEDKKEIEKLIKKVSYFINGLRISENFVMKDKDFFALCEPEESEFKGQMFNPSAVYGKGRPVTNIFPLWSFSSIMWSTQWLTEGLQTKDESLVGLLTYHLPKSLSLSAKFLTEENKNLLKKYIRKLLNLATKRFAQAKEKKAVDITNPSELRTKLEKTKTITEMFSVFEKFFKAKEEIQGTN